MGSYAYTAINATGAELTGEINAPDVSAAREALRVRGLLATELNAQDGEGKAAGVAVKKVKPKSLQIFSRQFATMIEAGLNVVTALVILEEQTEDKKLALVIAELRVDVEGGLLPPRPWRAIRGSSPFSSLPWSRPARRRESSTSCSTVSPTRSRRRRKIKRRVKGAMMYPIMVLSFATLVLIGMLLFLVPIFVNIFSQLGGDLPMLTQIVVTASDFLRARWYIVFPFLGLTFWGIRRFKKTEKGRRLWDKIRIRAPAGIGKVIIKIGMARFSRTLSTLVAAGVDIIRSLEITGTTAGNSLIEDATNHVKERVTQGVPIAVPLAESAIFPPMVSHMVRVGEETGELEKMLSKIADFYEDEVDSAIASLTSIIEPLMMIAVGVVVGIIIISMYLPMFKLLTLIQ